MLITILCFLEKGNNSASLGSSFTFMAFGWAWCRPRGAMTLQNQFHGLSYKRGSMLELSKTDVGAATEVFTGKYM